MSFSQVEDLVKTAQVEEVANPEYIDPEKWTFPDSQEGENNIETPYRYILGPTGLNRCQLDQNIKWSLFHALGAL